MAWTEITPAGVPAGGERTELALAASTNGVGQVVYAVSRASNNVNYNQDVLFAPSCTYTDTNPYAYDSPRNTLYIPDECYPNQSIRRVTGVGSTLNYTRFVMYDYPSFMKLGIDQTSLFIGFSNGRVIKYTNLNQTTPTSTTVAGLGLPISSIDVGASDNELLVTLSSYGVSSVWYTNNGGATWVNKDPAGSGLADVPVRAGLFNPQNRQQVVLATDLGIWTTNDISASNPGWALSSKGLGLVKINRLSYRASDGRLVAATAGRGIFETNALAVAYTPSSISITGISNTTLCAGNTFTVSFSVVGTSTTNYQGFLIKPV